MHTADFWQVSFEEDREEVLATAKGNTKLTGWIDYNQEDISLWNIFYADIISIYTWGKDRKRYKRHGWKEPRAISRLVKVCHHDHEWFHLILLYVSVGAGYDDLKTVNGIVHNTFKETSVARDLIPDNQLWIDSIKEAVANQMPRQFMKHMFSYMLVFRNINDPLQIWEQFHENFAKTILIMG